MEQYNIHLCDRVHASNLYIGAVYHSYSIRLNRRFVDANVCVGTISKSLPVQLRNRHVETNVHIRKLPVRDSIRVVGGLKMTSHQPLTESHKHVALDETRAVLEMEIGKDVFCFCEDLLTVFETSSIATESTMYSSIDNEASLSSVVGATSTSKNMPVQHCVQLISEVGASIEHSCSIGESLTYLHSSVNISEMKYRRIQDMDTDEVNITDLHLNNFDDIAIEDIDYVVL